MFEDRTYENIMKEMMSEMPDDINTEEGSLIFNACAKQALKLEEAYLSMAYIYDNMLPDTQDEEHLIRYSKERGVEIKKATHAILLGVFNQEIETGTRFTLNDMDYTVVECIGGFNYRLECEEEGTVGNTSFGELDPVDYVDEWQGGQITKVLVPGVNREDTEVFRQRVFDTFTTKAFGGNRADYIRFFNEMDEVGSIKAERRDMAATCIDVYFTDRDFRVPSTVVVSSVQEKVDPESSQGDGNGRAPIGHKVMVHPVIGVTIDIETKITFENGYSYDAVKSYIDSKVSEYFSELRAKWSDSENLTVRISQLESRILSVDGIADISGSKLNGKDENYVLGTYEIPLEGEFNAV